MEGSKISIVGARSEILLYDFYFVFHTEAFYSCWGQMFPVALFQVCTHWSFQWCHWASQFELPVNIFFSIQVWRLTWPLQDLEMVLTEPVLSSPGCVFRFIVMLENPAIARDPSSMLWLKEIVALCLALHGPAPCTVQSSCPLCLKTVWQSSVLHSRDSVVGMVLIFLPD